VERGKGDLNATYLPRLAMLSFNLMHLISVLWKISGLI
jgi:hypothetical protein